MGVEGIRRMDIVSSAKYSCAQRKRNALLATNLKINENASMFGVSCGSSRHILVNFVFLVAVVLGAMRRNVVAAAKSSMDSVAVIGGGFAGLAIGNQLARTCKQLTIYDLKPPGEAGSSSSAGGLLHPFAPRGNFVWKGNEGFDATLDVIEKMKGANIATTDLFNDVHRVLRPVFKVSDLENWRAACIKQPDYVQELPPSDYPVRESSLSKPLLGLFRLTRSATIDSPKYLRSLWKLIQHECPTAQWRSDVFVDNLADLLSNHSTVIIAAGLGSPSFFPANMRLNVKYVKGRNLHYTFRQNSFSAGTSGCLSCPLLAGEYVVPRLVTRTGSSDPELMEIVAGASHEHILEPDDTNTLLRLVSDSGVSSAAHVSSGDIADARNLLANRLAQLHPKLDAEYDLTAISRGVRLVTERSNLGRLPIVGRHPQFLPTSERGQDTSKGVWVLTGLGSRGLVYHALMAQYLSRAILSNDETIIPTELLPRNHLAKTVSDGKAL